MKGLNRVELIGRLTKDPELVTLPSGTVATTITLAVPDDKRNQEGGYEEIVDFVRVSFYGSGAELVCNHLAKGSQIWVEGRLKITRNQEGVYHSCVISKKVIFLGHSRRHEESLARMEDSGRFDEEIPF